MNDYNPAPLTTRIPDELYVQILTNVPVCCVDLIVAQENKVLLVKRATEPIKNEWCVPGGRVYRNETLKQAAIRKTFEEVGLRAEKVRNFGVYEFLWPIAHFKDVPNGVHTIDAACIVEPFPGQKIKLDSTSSDYKWVEAVDSSYPKLVQDILGDYFSSRNRR